jgi:MATE family multidrug resistance protein
MIQSDPKRPAGGYREFFTIAYPLVISNASMTVMVFVDRLLLSWASAENIAAAIPTVVLLFTFWSIFIGVSEYTNTFVAQFYGAGRRMEIGKAAWQGIYFSLFGAVLTLPFYPLGYVFLDWGGHAPAILSLEKQYFSWLYWGGPFFILNGALSSFYSGRGRTKVIMTINIIANLINLVLDYALIFGVWGFPEMGIRGAALATVLSTVAASAIYLVLFLSSANDQIYGTRRMWRFDRDLMRRLIRFGFPSGIHFFLEVSAFSMFVFLIGRIGNVELAASNIALSLNMLAWFPMVGASIATTTLVGQYIGRKQKENAIKSAFTAFLAVEAYMIGFAGIFILFSGPLVHLFQSRSGVDISFAEVAPMGAKLLICVALYQIFDAMLLTFSGALRGVGDTAFAMWACVICAWCVFVPGTWLVAEYLKLGIFAAWGWLFLYSFMMGLLYLKRFTSRRWEAIHVIPDSMEQANDSPL